MQRVIAGRIIAVYPVRKQEILDFISNQQYQEAIDATIDLYGLDVSGVNGKPTFDPDLNDAGETLTNATMNIGPKAFLTAGLLRSTLEHELVHIDQLYRGDYYIDGDGLLLNEIEAYDLELANAEKNGLTDFQIGNIGIIRKAHYDSLTTETQDLVDQGVYSIPDAPAAPIPEPPLPTPW